MRTDITQEVKDFMRKRYGVNVTEGTIDTLVKNEFRLVPTAKEQFNICWLVEEKIRGYDKGSLAAKVFSLAYSYDYVLGNQRSLIGKWSAWLGEAEFRYSKKVSLRTSRVIIHYSLNHFLKAKDWGNDTPKNSAYIARCCFILKKYRKALHFSLEAREREDESGENTYRIGRCYLQLREFEQALPFLLEVQKEIGKTQEKLINLGKCYIALCRYDEGISAYEQSLEQAKKEELDRKWIRRFDEELWRTYTSLRKTDKIEDSDRITLLKRLDSLSHKFADYWDQNLGQKNHPRLIEWGDGVRVSTVEKLLSQYRP